MNRGKCLKSFSQITLVDVVLPTWQSAEIRKRLHQPTDRAPTNPVATARPEAACGVRTNTNVVETSLRPTLI